MLTEQTGKEADSHGSPSAADGDAAAPLDPAAIAKQQLANILAAGERTALMQRIVHLDVRTAWRHSQLRSTPGPVIMPHDLQDRSSWARWPRCAWSAWSHWHGP